MLRTTFDSSTNLTTWTNLGNGSRISGGWTLTGISLPTNADSSFGVLTNQFGFNISGSSGQVVIVEVSTNLVNWTPLRTNTLGSGPYYFADPDWLAFNSRFYRLRLQ